MKYFGIPKCPYCKKRINLIRVWRLKKHGEYICPRCKGISNIFHSPLIYALALLSCAAGFLVYFFEKYITDSVDFSTVFKVFIPFVLFYVLSLFMVYLEKPVIRKVFKREDGKMVDENGEVISIAVNTILSSGGKKVNKEVKNPANAEVRNLRNDPVRYKDSSETIRRVSKTDVNTVASSADKVKNSDSEVKPKVNSAANPALNDDNKAVNKVQAEEKRSETKYTDEELKNLEKLSDKGQRENGQKTIRSRYRNESEFDEIFGETQEISDRRLRSAKVKNSAAVPSLNTPSIVKNPEVKKETETKAAEPVKEEKKENVKRFREL